MTEKIEHLLQQKERKFNSAQLAALSAYFRTEMFTILHERGTGHWGGSASATEIITSLYFNRMNIKPENPQWEDRDRFVLSKGHASVNLYTILAHRGYFDPEDLHSFRKFGSHLQGHPCMTKTPGVDMSTGALGHGLSVGQGMALAARLGKKNYWTYVLTGEGCLDEGQTWEAIMSAAKYKPRGLVLLIDHNKVQLDGSEDQILPLGNLNDKFRTFGWHVYGKPCNGNDCEDILKSFQWLDSDDIWPKVIVYDTTKGKGISFTENTNKWHGAVVDDNSYVKGILELDADLETKEERI